MTEKDIHEAEVKAKDFITQFRNLCRLHNIDSAMILASNRNQVYSGTYECDYSEESETSSLVQAISDSVNEALLTYKVASGKIS